MTVTEQTPTEAEATASEPEPEVRPEEFTQGIERPVGASAFGQSIEEELRKPLDPNRVRRRQGRGRGSFEYLAGHDVKRRANEIFGFGKWGHRVSSLKKIGEVEVVNDKGTPGWHVGYRCVVSVWIEGMEMPTEGVGYGDGVEYTAAARITACELAMKEAETDALKRAFTNLGDQFGLILYAKDDEKKRIERDLNEQATSTRIVEGPPIDFPKSWAAIGARIAEVVGGEDDAREWITQAREAYLGKPWDEALAAQKNDTFQKFVTITVDLEQLDLDFKTGTRLDIQRVLANRLNGAHVEGPPWSLDPEEAKAGRPPKLPPTGDFVPGMAEAMDAAAEMDAEANRDATYQIGES